MSTVAWPRGDGALSRATVANAMHEGVFSCPRTASLAAVAELMAARRVHARRSPRRSRRRSLALGRHLRPRPRSRRQRARPRGADGRRDGGEPRAHRPARRDLAARCAAHDGALSRSPGRGRRSGPAARRDLHARHRGCADRPLLTGPRDGRRVGLRRSTRDGAGHRSRRAPLPRSFTALPAPGSGSRTRSPRAS